MTKTQVPLFTFEKLYYWKKLMAKKQKFVEKLYSFILKDFILFVSLIALIPFLYLSLFAYPTADDFCYSFEASTRGFAGAAYYWFTRWSGRYFANSFLGTTPLVMQYPLLYKLSPIILILFLLGGIFLVLSLLLRHIFSARETLAISLLLLIAFIAGMPILSDGFYWFNGAMTHMLGLILFFYYFGYLILFTQAERFLTRYISFTLLCVFTIIAIGSSETIAVLILVCSIFSVVNFLINEKKISLPRAFLAVLSIFCTAVMFLSTGNSVRIAEYPHSREIMHTIIGAAKSMWTYSVRWLVFTPILPVSVTFFLLLLKRANKLLSVNSIWGKLAVTITLPFLSVFLLSVPSYWGQGDEPVYRTQNIIYVIMFLLILWNVYLGAIALKNMPQLKIEDFFKNANGERVSNSLYNALLVIGILWTFTGIIVSKNYMSAVFDIYYSKESLYLEQENHRLAQIRNCKNIGKDQCVVMPISIAPTTTFHLDITSNAKKYQNICVAKYYGLTTIVTDH